MPLPDPYIALGFAFNPLNRHSEKRDDDAFTDRLFHDPSTCFVAFSGDVPLFKVTNGHDVLFSADEAARFGPPAQTVFLGRETSGEHEGRALFALGFGKDTDVAPGVEPIDLRATALRELVEPALVGALGQAKSMLDWHRRHGFCANCGQPSRVAAAGWRRHCDACGAQHFPRVDPVVIMLAIDGEQCLLGRQRQFAPGMYSALAGFVEPGETAADAVTREVLEEAGIRCSRVTPFATQPWPFPSSLMMGCFAHADDTNITVDTVELEDARWFSRAEIIAMLDGTHADGLSAPKPYAIAHHLLRAYADHGAAVLA